MENIAVKLFESAEQACVAVAERIRDVITNHNAQDKPTVLGLATGSTPIGVYNALVCMHKQDHLDFSRVITFNLDEYWPMTPQALQSYHTWMRVYFFDHVNIPAENIHIPDGCVDEEHVEASCLDYEAAIKRVGGLDFQILGIGRTGHIGFNEPGSSPDSRTRQVQLDKVTLKDAAADFFGEENVPRQALTMGVGTIMEAREIAILAFGEHKAGIVKRAIEGAVDGEVAASYLQQHTHATYFIDDAAGASLTRVATPWLLGPCHWDKSLAHKAVIWLAHHVRKPVLKLTEEDYIENYLGELIRQHGPTYDLNVTVFRRLMNTITSWPAGRSGKKRILILSPHPDDDVICMAGTMMRLVQQGHTVHTAYMVSGSLSVFDHNVQRHAEFVQQFNRIFRLDTEQTDVIEAHIEQYLNQKQTGETDSPEIRAIKTLIRRTEAMAAARFCGLAEETIHFLDLPFYDTDWLQKRAIGLQDIERVTQLLCTVDPDIIFAAGDLSDPHGTHRLCLETLTQALSCQTERRRDPVDIWLYRGAWQEWTPEQIGMAVPLSPDVLRRKRYAIFRHESQKDKAMFPGPCDDREFWQRAEERNMATAALYDHLGLPEYYAIEAFARWPLIRTIPKPLPSSPLFQSNREDREENL